MWIRTQDKKKLITRISGISVQKNFGSRSKFSLVVAYGGAASLEMATEVLGQYTSEEEALAELQRLQEHINSGIDQVFTMAE
ncbi:hypothetical protein [Spirochaeta lutea]|uniref:Uncharacterized protein n=1 Tax=Spirochaeta lutea TaxID=1480694 RepID=A0A098R586_9SPIO|nr:hypothetical protein [Spirochaeta lutea]KGE73897.1 hypothetical protein DC28_01470 [Spirochaeta lutea]